ncbi:MAG: SDR family NAD(P)-dependent oxidoreductase [Acidobacteria bacterium]|nr:SDR family NAD(P)-dependent oxidoreductase [Acidobacteriota bacterium]
MKNKAVVTGGCGFIGSHIVEILLKSDWQVVIIDNLSGGSVENIKDFKSDIKLIIDDIRNEEALLAAFKDAQVVFHQAAFISVPESEKNPDECFDVNISGTIKVAKAAKKVGVRKIVFASSCAVYGSNKNIPLKEDDVLMPLSPYAYSKKVCEEILRQVAQNNKISITALRYFNVYGPRQNPKGMYAAVISKFLNDGIRNRKITVEGTGQQTRDFVYVKDVAMANLLAAKSITEGFDVFNICSSAETSIISLAKEVSNLIGETKILYASARENDIQRSCGNCEKAKKVLGYNPAITLKEGLKLTYDYEKERVLNE